MIGRVRQTSDRPDLVLSFIGKYRSEWGIAPTYREIGAACGITSMSVVKYWLDKLEENDYIKRYPRMARGIILIDEPLAENA